MTQINQYLNYQQHLSQINNLMDEKFRMHPNERTNTPDDSSKNKGEQQQHRNQQNTQAIQKSIGIIKNKESSSDKTENQNIVETLNQFTTGTDSDSSNDQQGLVRKHLDIYAYFDYHSLQQKMKQQAQNYTGIFFDQQRVKKIQLNCDNSQKTKQYAVHSMINSTRSMSTQVSMNLLVQKILRHHDSISFGRQKVLQQNRLDIEAGLGDLQYFFKRDALLHYYEAFVNVQTILYQFLRGNQQFDSFKDIDKETILFPPVLDVRDFHFVFGKNQYKLKKDLNLYQTPKSYLLIKLQIKIKYLALFITNIEWVDKSQRIASIECIERQVQHFIKQVLNGVLPYLTQQLLYGLASDIKERLQQKYKVSPQNRKSSQLSTNKQKTIQGNIQQKPIHFKEQLKYIQIQPIKIQKQPFYIQEQLQQFLQKCLIDFCEWVCFFNYVITCYQFYYQKQPPLIIYLSSLDQQLTASDVQGMSIADRKLQLFWKSYKNQNLLRRLFRDSLNVQQLQRRQENLKMAEIIRWCPFNLNYFCLNIYPLKSQLLKIQSFVRYDIHLGQYRNQIVNDLFQSNSISLDVVFNCVRFILIFLAIKFTSLLLNRIEMEIQFRCGRLVRNLFVESRNKSKKFLESSKKAQKALDFSFQKIQKYIESLKKQDQAKTSSNVRKIGKMDQQYPDLISFIYQLRKQENQKRTFGKQEQNITKIYNYITLLISNEYLCQKILEKSYKKLTNKYFGTECLEFSKFMKNEPIDQSNCQANNFLKSMKQFQKQFKICVIQCIKIYNLITTIPLYSYQTQRQNDIIRIMKRQGNLAPKRKQPKEFAQIIRMLDLFYIFRSEKLNTQNLINKKDIKEINQVLKKYVKYTLKITQFYEKQDKNNRYDILHFQKRPQSTKSQLPGSKSGVQVQPQEKEKEQKRRQLQKREIQKNVKNKKQMKKTQAQGAYDKNIDLTREKQCTRQSQSEYCINEKQQGMKLSLKGINLTKQTPDQLNSLIIRQLHPWISSALSLQQTFHVIKSVQKSLQNTLKPHIMSMSYLKKIIQLEYKFKNSNGTIARLSQTIKLEQCTQKKTMEEKWY